MPLASTNEDIAPEVIFPDGMEVCFQYQFNNNTDARVWRSAMRHHDFTRTRSSYYAGLLRFNYLDQSFPIAVRCGMPAGRSSIIVYANFSPLTFLNIQSGRAITEVSRVLDHRNLLHEDLLGQNNSSVSVDAHGIILQIEFAISEFVIDMARRCGSQWSSLRSITLEKIELAIDFCTRDPDRMVEDFISPFRRRFRNQLLHGYPNQDGNTKVSAAQVNGVAQDSRMVSGYRAPHERYKAYSKTNRRVRLECQLGKSAVKSILLENLGSASRHVGDLDTFLQKYDALVACVAPNFQEVVAELSHAYGPGRSVLEFLTNLARYIRRADVLADVVAVLVRNQSITARYDRHLVRQLSLSRSGQAPILVRRRQGFYRLAPEYIGAAEYLRTHPDFLPHFLQGSLS